MEYSRTIGRTGRQAGSSYIEYPFLKIRECDWEDATYIISRPTHVGLHGENPEGRSCIIFRARTSPSHFWHPSAN